MKPLYWMHHMFTGEIYHMSIATNINFIEQNSTIIDDSLPFLDH